MLLLREDNSGTPVSRKGECKKKKTLSGEEEGKETEGKGGRRDKEYNKFYKTS